MTLKDQQIARDKDITDFKKHKEDIRIAAEQAKDVISNAAAIAARAISDAAAVSVKVLSVKNADDHDLLIELKVGNQFIRDDIKNLSSGVSVKIEQLQETKAEKKELEALAEEIHVVREQRMRKLEDRTFNFWIAFGFVMVGVTALFAILLQHINK